MFTTGEFSKIARVSRRLLRHYRDIGLFTPTHVDPQSGYHYYSIYQLPDLNRILALRDLGFTLEQIQRTVANTVSPEELRGMLQMRKAEIERSLLEELQKIRTIESRLQQIEQGKPELEVIIKSIPKLPYLSATFICATAEDGLDHISKMRRSLPQHIKANALGEMITILHSEDFTTEDANVEMGFAVMSNTNVKPIAIDDLTFAIRTLEAVETMATVVVNGSPDFWHLGTTAIGHWMQANNYTLAGPHREIWHTYPTDMTTSPMVELQIPVKRKPNLTTLQLNPET